MDTTILQVPIEKTFRDDVSKVVEDMGFSSLQDYIRLFLKKTLKKRWVSRLKDFLRLSFLPEMRKDMTRWSRMSFLEKLKLNPTLMLKNCWLI